jgi:hypothetical protein
MEERFGFRNGHAAIYIFLRLSELVTLPFNKGNSIFLSFRLLEGDLRSVDTRLISKLFEERVPTM